MDNEIRVEEFKNNLIELQSLFKEFFLINHNQKINNNNHQLCNNSSYNSTSSLNSNSNNFNSNLKSESFGNDFNYDDNDDDDDDDDSEFIINNQNNEIIYNNNNKWININEIDLFYSKTLNNINNNNRKKNNIKINNNNNNNNKNNHKTVEKSKCINSRSNSNFSSFSSLSFLSSSELDLYTKLNVSTYRISNNNKKRSISIFENSNQVISTASNPNSNIATGSLSSTFNSNSNISVEINQSLISKRTKSDIPIKRFKSYSNPLKLTL